jgi:hypothetical protein
VIVDLVNVPIRPRLGLSDLLRKIIFCTAVSGLRNDRILYIRQEPTFGCPYSFIDLCDIKGFVLRPWNESLGSAELTMAANDLSFDSRGVKLYKPRDLTIGDEEFLELWIQSYQLLCPKSHIKSRIDSLQVDENCIGFHVRRTDKVNKNPDSWEIHENKKSLLERKSRYAISWVLREHKTRKIFLACDNEQSKLYWTRYLVQKKCTVIANNSFFDSNKFRQTSGEDFIIDLFALARCGVIIQTIPSGVVDTAARINGKNKIVYASQFTFLKTLSLFCPLMHKVRQTVKTIIN